MLKNIVCMYVCMIYLQYEKIYGKKKESPFKKAKLSSPPATSKFPINNNSSAANSSPSANNNNNRWATPQLSFF